LFAAFRVEGWAFEVGLAEGADKLEVPDTGGAEELERGRQVVGGVVLRPGGLVEGLEERGFAGGCGEGLAEPEAEGELTVGEVGEDLAWAPLARRDGSFDLLRGEGADGLVDQSGCRGEDGAGVVGAELDGVWVGHSVTLPRLAFPLKAG